MKIKQLIQKLNKLNPEAEVVLSSDGEGNSFSYLYDVEADLYSHRPHGEELRLYDKDDLKVLDKTLKPKQCVVLFPC